MQKMIAAGMALLAMTGCASRGATGAATAAESEAGKATDAAVTFDADSAYAYVARQVEFGPRVPNSEAHRRAGEWLAGELRRHGATVEEQRADLRAFDGTVLKATNIFARFNPDAGDRVLLLAHWDTRPWADEDPDPANRRKPVDGANDGASGAGVLLELARHAAAQKRGVDILLVDAEDWGTTGSDDSWAMGAQYFADNLPDGGAYRPEAAILLDMVGGRGATFCREYFSQQAAPGLADAIWSEARAAGYGEMFPDRMGTAVTDDHVKLIAGGIPAIDIIDYREGEGFCPTWHTLSDTMEDIDRATLKAVGQTVANYLWKR